MKALLIPEPLSTKWTSIPDPDPADLGKDDVLLKIRRIGYCGTDLNIYRGLNPLAAYPRIPGHEIAATIEAVGSAVPAQWALGLAVTCSPYTACNRCSSCKAKRFNACRENETLGVQRDGALREYFVISHEKLFASPTLSLEELALVEPFSIGFHAANRGRVTADDTVMVLGSGTIGLGAILGAAEHGARVIAVDIDDGKLDLARKLGAQETINSTRQDTVKVAAELTEGEGPDVVIEAIGLPVTYRQAVESVAHCGRVVYIGYAKDDVAYQTKLFVAKELDILGSRNSLHEFSEVIACFEKKKVDPRLLISRQATLDEAPEALSDWNKDPSAYTKIMVNLD